MSPFDPFRGGGHQKGTMSPFFTVFFFHESFPYIASLNYMPCNIIYNMNLSIIEGVAAARGKLTRLQKKVTVGEEGLLRQESLNQRGEVGIFI